MEVIQSKIKFSPRIASLVLVELLAMRVWHWRS